MKIYYDGACRICCEQRDRFLRHDPDQQRLVHIDISDPDFDPALDPATAGTTRESLLASIHAGTPDGRLLKGMDAVRCAYTALGRGWWLAPTGWPLIKPIADFLYGILARNRYRLGRSGCDGDSCRPRL